jgi:zinc protease
MRAQEKLFKGALAMKILGLNSKSNWQPALAALVLVAFAAPLAPTARAQEKSTPLGEVQRLNRAPVNKEVLRVQLPRPTVVRLKNGLTLLLLENHKLPTVVFSLWIRPGQLADPTDIPGLASFAAGMLREGTERRTSSQIANETESLGASLSASAAFGSSYLSVDASGLVNDAPQILDLLSDTVLHPSFPAGELAQYKQREQASLEQRLSNPSFLARQAFRRVLYGDAPLSVTSPTKESIERVTADDLKKFHDAHFRPGNSLLGVTGDFNTTDMQALVEKYFGGWMGAAEPPMKLPVNAPPQPAKITLVDRPNSVQTFIIGGDRSIRRTDPDFYALTVMNQVLGGGPQSRLFLDLREVHSYTYGVYSRFNSEIYPGDWTTSTAVRTPVTDGSMTQLLYELKRINNEPVPQGELDESRRAIVAGFALSLEQPAQVLASWLTVQHFGLPADYWNAYPDHIAAIDAPAVQAAAKKFTDLDHLQWICVGDRKQIQDVLAKYGPVAVVDVNGKSEN